MTETPRSDVWPVRTPRLQIRPMTASDIDVMWEWRRLPEANRWIGLAPDTLDAFRERYLDADRLAAMYVVELLPENGETVAIGDTGHGYATEAIRAVIDACFGPLGLRRVHAGCFAANEASWRLMERLGMRREEFSRRTALHRSGEWLDGMNYGILAEEWAAHRPQHRRSE
jgi:RimJ/RimL family protein N-acetyltransferase